MKNLGNGEDGNKSWCQNVSAAFLPGNTSPFHTQSTHKLHVVLKHHLITLSSLKAAFSQLLNQKLTSTAQVHLPPLPWSPFRNSVN